VRGAEDDEGVLEAALVLVAEEVGAQGEVGGVLVVADEIHTLLLGLEEVEDGVVGELHDSRGRGAQVRLGRRPVPG
jgi:hypothetical protein